MSTTPFDFGDIVLVPFPVTNLAASKKRPAVVVSAADYGRARPDVIIMAVTSQLQATQGQFEISVENWQAAGLLKPSCIKPVMATLEQRLVLRRLGALAGQDQAALRVGIGRILG